MADDIVTVADMVADALDLSGAQVSDLRNAAPLVARLPTTESSNGDTHKYSKETGAPVVGFRAENAGRDFDVSADTVVTVTLKIIDFSYMADKAVADRWRKGGADAWMEREGMRHLKAALSLYEKQIIYGTGNDSDGFAGLIDNAQLDALADTMVINAGGTTATTGSSCFFMRLGENDMQGVYRGDMVNPFDIGERVIQDFTDGDGKHFPGYYVPATGWLGMQIGGAYSVGRIANLTEDSGKGLSDDLGFQLLAKFPPGARDNMVCVTNTRSVRQLQKSRTATNVTGAPAPWPTMICNNIPIIETDSILETEAIET